MLDKNSIASSTMYNQAYGISADLQHDMYRQGTISMGMLVKPPLGDYRSTSPSYVGMNSAPVATTFGHAGTEDDSDSDQFYEKIDDLNETIASNPLYSGRVTVNHNTGDQNPESA